MREYNPVSLTFKDLEPWNGFQRYLSRNRDRFNDIGFADRTMLLLVYNLATNPIRSVRFMIGAKYGKGIQLEDIEN